jgi:tetratricopeptide (TPR) repeat protein
MSKAGEEYYSSDSSGGSDDEEVKKRGNFAYKKGKYDKAIDRFTRCLTLGQKNLQRQIKREKATGGSSSSSSGSSEAPAEASVAASVSVSDEGNVTSSADSTSSKTPADSDAISALKKKIAVYYSNRGLAYIGKERWREALADCQKSIETTPTECPPKAWYNTARCFSQLKEYEDCIELIQRGTKVLQKREAANRGALQNMKDLLSRAVGALQQKVDETVVMGKDQIVDPLYLYKNERLKKGEVKEYIDILNRTILATATSNKFSFLISGLSLHIFHIMKT